MKQSTAVLLLTLIFVVLVFVGGARPSAHASEQGEVWEITVSATSHLHTHGVSNPANEHRLNDIDETYTVYLSERLKGSYDADGRLDLGEEPEFVGTPIASGSASWVSHTRTTVERDLQEQWVTRDGTVDPPPSGAGAHFAWDGPTRQVVFEVGGHYTGTLTSREHVIYVGNNVDRTTSHSEPWVHDASFAGTTHPLKVKQTKTGFALDWSWTESTHDPGGPTKENTESGHADIHRYVPHEPMELIVSPAAYQTWLPQAGKDQKTPGNTLAVQATLKTKSGKAIPADQKAARIRFELTRVSHEPGICMNVPRLIETLADNNDPDPDLQFAPAGAMTLWPADHPSTADTPDGQDGLTSASALIASYDWGAWGSLRVTAQLDDGETILGHLEGKRDTDILVPRRHSRGEQTAAYWKEQRGIALPDDDDSEKLVEPANVGSPGHSMVPADRRPGDGYTVYEEYRGFIENGVHIFGDPTRKDLMVRDEIGGRSKDGIRLFEAITGIRVHHRFTESEVESDRIMNGNYDPGVHQVDQHNLVLTTGASEDASSTSGIPGGPPGQHPSIGISHDLSSGPDGWSVIRQGRGKVLTDEYASTIAHEMLHACGVLHHGDSDPGYVLWMKGTDTNGKDVIIESGYTKLKDGVVRANPGGYPVDVRHEDHQPVSPALFAKGALVWIGAAGGQHSGLTDCVMRYDVAEAYKPDANSPLRYYVHEETGISLCDSKTDAAGGINRADRTPQSRYGDATEGNCFHQILVRDRQ